MSTQNQSQSNPTSPIKKLTFTPQTEEENHLTQTIKQYASIEGIQIHDILLEALLHLASEKDIFKPSTLSGIKKQKCAMHNCREPVKFEALYKLDNTVKRLCFCHGNSVASGLQRGNYTNLWVYSRPLTVEAAPACKQMAASTQAVPTVEESS
ncbi:hypothetical protein [Candidatus Bathycorpusculum sp.]|uniref:hypothetical protein n=1 Tax=Candidatus Bathycorpusculum sp. TaxID=2994959 RepID=UPI002819D53B|nr:hypothetical protein [Candidatus Termitimicrobium sp.]MCL2685944.1 hypothetical protein [Candidatus Termitimicrobium sp.]